MRKFKYILFSIVALAGCNKAQLPSPDNEGEYGSPIQFSVSADQVELKSSVESLTDLVYDATTNPNAHVFLYATKDGSNFQQVDTNSTADPKPYLYNYCNKELLYNSSTNLWDINLLSGERKEPWDYNSTAKRACEYNFSAYAVRGTNIDTVVVSSFNSFGRSFIVDNDKTYTKNCGTDYLLSNSVSVNTTWSGSAARGQLVHLHMEHAMASVRVKVVVNKSLYAVGIQGIQINDFYRGATMQCISQASYGSGKSNKWSTTLPTDRGTNYIYGDVKTTTEGNTYSTIESCPFKYDNSGDKREEIIMDFIAVPQDPSFAVLTIAYLVQEESGATIHQLVSSWDLSSYSEWESGYRNTYTITINTSNSLTAGIDNWNEGNTVHGVILP